MRNEVLAQFTLAPFSGVVTNTYVKEGDGPPGMPLSIEGAKLEVSAMVSETDITSIKECLSAF
jgi:hypothetical protein